MKKYDVFLFDADDTLYDFDKSEETALKRAFGEYGFLYNENALEIYRFFNVQCWDLYERGDISKDELQILRFEKLFKLLNEKCDAAEFNRIFLAELGKGAFLVDGALEICREIVAKGKRIYIVTNGILATQESRINHSLIKDYISDFFVSERVGYKKPQTEYFEYVFKCASVNDKRKVLIIGDSLAADVAGGINAGIDSCWVNAAGAANDTGFKPTYEIRNLRELGVFI
jgi:YjjG family noncanonical pyrimidine nucleotidase